MARPTGRVLTLLELLQSGGTRTVAELAGRLGVDGRTVRRYVDHLIDLEIPVESVRGRYGGYRLAPGYRLPPLMFTDEEALAVLLGLLGRRTGWAATDAAPSETAAAKIRRVLPQPLRRRLDVLLESLEFTHAPTESAPADAAVLLTLADAVRHHRPVTIRYTDRHGRASERTLHAYGIVAHSGRWYVTGADPRHAEDRTFRLDRITTARTLPGSFDPPGDIDPVGRLVSGFAAAEYRYDVSLRIFGTHEQIRAHLPATVATLGATDEAADSGAERWWEVGIRAERLDWLPPVLAALDRPFDVRHPEELRELVLGLAARLAESGRRTAPADD